jgi:dipeptidase D
MGVVTTYEDKIVVVEMIRNSTNGMFELIADVLLDLADTVGVTAYPYTTFPAFDYSSNSPLRDLAMDLYKRTTGKDAAIRAVHGGTECGVFRTLCPGIDIIGFGPIKGEAHTFAEWMDMDSYNTAFCSVVVEVTAVTIGIKGCEAFVFTKRKHKPIRSVDIFSKWHICPL